MKLNQILKTTGVALLLALAAATVSAQDNPPGQDRPGRGNRGGGPGGPGGNFDPAQFQQRMMDRTKEQLELTDETEWKAVEPLVAKVMEARRETLSGFGRGFGGGRGNRGGFGGTPDPEAEALQKAIDSKASATEIKAALAKYLESRKAKQAALEKAQAALRKVLTPRQEAIAALNGLL
jgi:Spy/CpxP family protein refolding chaperone